MAGNAEPLDDLRYVRTVVESADRTLPVRGIYLLWALIIPVGFLLADVAPEVVTWFWLVAGPVGGVASFVIGWRGGSALGQESRAEARRHALHWLGLGGGIVLIVFLGLVSIGAPMSAVAPLILAVVALGWFLAGVYGDPAMMWLGAALAVAAAVTGLVDPWAWTISGVVLGVALVVVALRTPRPVSR